MEQQLTFVDYIHSLEQKLLDEVFASLDEMSEAGGIFDWEELDYQKMVSEEVIESAQAAWHPGRGT